MSSLAQAIIDTAHNMKIKPSKTHSTFSKAYYHASSHLITNHATAQYVAEGQAKLFSDLPYLAPLIKKALRFSINQDVADAAVKMSNTPMETLGKALKFATPPHNPVWIEFALPEGDLKVGWLIHKQEDQFHVHYSFSTPKMNHIPQHNKDTMYGIISSRGVLFGNQNHDFSEEDALKVLKGIQKNCRDAINFLLLLNSRSRILKVEEPQEDFSKLNRARRRSNKEKIFPMHRIVFDVARIIEKKGTSETCAAQEMAAALVRGHFKVRQTGVFFWSPYVRGAHDENHKKEVYGREIATERRETIITGPCALPSP